MYDIVYGDIDVVALHYAIHSSAIVTCYIITCCCCCMGGEWWMGVRGEGWRGEDELGSEGKGVKAE